MSADERERRRLLAETETQIRQHEVYQYWDERLKAEERMDSERKAHPSTPGPEEIGQCREQAERGDPEAMYRLAIIYQRTERPETGIPRRQTSATLSARS